MKKFTGLAGAGGRDVSQTVILHRQKLILGKKAVDDCEQEIKRFEKVRCEYAGELEELYRTALADAGEKTAGIFKAYRTIVEDDFLFKNPIQTVREEHIGIDYAIEQEKEKISAKFASMYLVLNILFSKLGMDKIKADPVTIRKKIGFMGEPMYIGLIVGIILGVVGNITTLNSMEGLLRQLV